MHGVKRGILISFEGVEGSGKTTQAKALAEWLSASKIPHIFVRDPGSTEIGEKIRGILLDRKNRGMHAKCEVLLFLAARSQLTYEVLLPALKEKKIVITDRFSDSTFAYQCYARGLPLRLVTVFNRFAAAGLKPDLTFLVEIEAAKRRERGKYVDRMETEAEGYHQKVQRGFELMAMRARKRYRILDGERSVDALHQEVVHHVKEILLRKGYKI
ncbi:MAG: dTMP kinase [candidate division WOR-3 bacterium]|nr:MAG: dTMP kinase [candidate division WOR-3 bacterium]